MGQKAKILVTEQGTFDLTIYKWDDHLFSDILTKENPIETDQAMDISRFLREEIDKWNSIPLPCRSSKKLFETKLLEYGLKNISPIRLDKSMFIKNGLKLSDNARNVLKRRYLKKDSKGRVIETPKEMFRRVAHHIAKAEKKYGVTPM